MAFTSSLLELCQDFLDERIGRVAVSGWITGASCDVEDLDLTVFNAHRVAFASGIPKYSGRIGSHREVKGLVENIGWVTHQCHDGAFRALVFGPSFHHSTIVDGNDDHLIHTLSLQRILGLQIARNRLVGSGRRESTRKPHENHLLSLAALDD
eukprot:gnl/TRDRNA2_/TRDRNA2_189634_c0_seq1.p1 gnl/TRDRNA2_/TRDRNA2_189634_c0~~gnl/TRDRNA2_/TRDRNA2_189634_c0_seq1.p1  ORF type:complete len:153 (-),score=10.27 gnl/TRDRNA2_/TRDRNA2_189634_c0_seq1:240-698(-)